LDPEINRSLEVGYHWRAARSARLDVRLFQERYSDYIGTFYRISPRSSRPCCRAIGSWTFANDHPLTVRGLEAQWEGRNLDRAPGCSPVTP
jgi:outer membrane cobalamin receptor